MNPKRLTVTIDTGTKELEGVISHSTDYCYTTPYPPHVRFLT